MKAADLRERIGFYARVDVDDGYGNTQAGFSEAAAFVVAANVKPKLGGEGVQAARLEGKNFENITVRQSTDTSSVTTDWRAKDERNGVIYNIRSIIDPDKETSQHGRWWEMLCEKGVAT